MLRLNSSNFAGKQEVNVYGAALTLADAFGLFEKVYGKPFNVTYRSDDECVEQLDNFLRAGNFDLAIYFSLCRVIGSNKVMPEGGRMTAFEGMELEDFEGTIRRTLSHD